jgi:hypothetical protein
MLAYFRMISKPVAREMYIQQLSSRLGVKAETIFSEYNKESKAKANTFKFQRRAGTEEKILEENKPPEANALAPSMGIRHAEKTLLEIALVSEETANKLGQELPLEKLSQTPIGKALNELINCSLNGEWENARSHLSDFERENPSPALSKILLQEDPYKDKQVAKAVADCLKVINEHYKKLKLADLMQQFTSASSEEKVNLMKQLQELTSS